MSTLNYIKQKNIWYEYLLSMLRVAYGPEKEN